MISRMNPLERVLSAWYFWDRPSSRTMNSMAAAKKKR